MRRAAVLLLVLGAASAGVVAALRQWGVIDRPSAARVRAVPRGHQEIAWIHAATNAGTWERFVAGVKRLRDERPGDLDVDLRGAFPQQTAAVPELSLAVKGCDARLWVRWYKLTSDAGVGKWVEALAERDPAPLAIIGGGSSDRARDLARALAERPRWAGKPPLLLITTATADRVSAADVLDPFQVDLTEVPRQDLIDVYPGRSFRFCFTNSQMAEAVVDFVWSRPDLRPHGPRDPGPAAAAAAYPAGGDAWTASAFVLAAAHAQQPTLNALQWADDPYSVDLAEQFCQVFGRPERQPNLRVVDSLPYSVGGYARANRREAAQAERLVGDVLLRGPESRSLLVLPTVTQPARRFLRAMALGAPLAVRNVVAVTGDSINFNNVYRDRNTTWNVQEVPVALVFFCHQNPIAWPELDRGKPPGPYATATDDELLNTDIVRTLMGAAFCGDDGPECRPRLLADADELRGRLHAVRPPLFRPDGNRVGGRGEYVVYLRPHVEEGRVLPRATVEVWSRQGETPQAPGSGWRPGRPLVIDYGDAPRGDR